MQRIGITPASTDPVVASVFATNSENFGNGILYIANSDDLAGVTINSGNVLASLEAEVGIELTPEEFANRASTSISSGIARDILARMGISIPTRITTGAISELLQDLPRLNSDQISQFVNEATNP